MLYGTEAQTQARQHRGWDTSHDEELNIKKTFICIAEPLPCFCKSHSMPEPQSEDMRLTRRDTPLYAEESDEGSSLIKQKLLTVIEGSHELLPVVSDSDLPSHTVPTPPPKGTIQFGPREGAAENGAADVRRGRNAEKPEDVQTPKQQHNNIFDVRADEMSPKERLIDDSTATTSCSSFGQVPTCSTFDTSSNSATNSSINSLGPSTFPSGRLSPPQQLIDCTTLLDSPLQVACSSSSVPTLPTFPAPPTTMCCFFDEDAYLTANNSTQAEMQSGAPLEISTKPTIPDTGLNPKGDGIDDEASRIGLAKQLAALAELSAGDEEGPLGKDYIAADGNSKSIDNGETHTEEFDITKVPKDDNGELLSIGSIGHPEGSCKPCVFFHNPQKGCNNGIHCLFCHYQHAPKKRLRLTRKKRAERAQGGQNQTEDGETNSEQLGDAKDLTVVDGSTTKNASAQGAISSNENKNNSKPAQQNPAAAAGGVSPKNHHPQQATNKGKGYASAAQRLRPRSLLKPAPPDPDAAVRHQPHSWWSPPPAPAVLAASSPQNPIPHPPDQWMQRVAGLVPLPDMLPSPSARVLFPQSSNDFVLPNIPLDDLGQRFQPQQLSPTYSPFHHNLNGSPQQHFSLLSSSGGMRASSCSAVLPLPLFSNATSFGSPPRFSFAPRGGSIPLPPRIPPNAAFPFPNRTSPPNPSLLPQQPRAPSFIFPAPPLHCDHSPPMIPASPSLFPQHQSPDHHPPFIMVPMPMPLTPRPANTSPQTAHMFPSTPRYTQANSLTPFFTFDDPLSLQPFTRQVSSLPTLPPSAVFGGELASSFCFPSTSGPLGPVSPLSPSAPLFPMPPPSSIPMQPHFQMTPNLSDL